MSTYQVWYKWGHCTDTTDGLHGIGNLHHEVITKLQWSLWTRLCLPTAKVVLALAIYLPSFPGLSHLYFWLLLLSVIKTGGSWNEATVQYPRACNYTTVFPSLYIHSNSPWFVSWGLPHLSFWPGFLPYPKDWADPVHQGNQRSSVKMLSTSS